MVKKLVNEILEDPISVMFGDNLLNFSRNVETDEQRFVGQFAAAIVTRTASARGRAKRPRGL